MARFRHIPNNAKEMKIEINPAYESERELLVRIPEERYAAEQTFCCDRNTVVRVNIGSHEYVVKRFKVPHLINRFAYTFIRKDKALRSYLNAFRLREAHFDTQSQWLTWLSTSRGCITLATMSPAIIPQSDWMN